MINDLIDQGTIVCPACKRLLRFIAPSSLLCQPCDRLYPVENGIPILLHQDSAFSAGQITKNKDTYFANTMAENRLKQRLRRALPSLGRDFGHADIDKLARSAVPFSTPPPLALLVGSGASSSTIRQRFPGLSWITSDVDLSYHPDLITDMQWLPLANESISFAVAEMVIEHVMNPIDAARELERVCKPDGIILVKIPFCFPWHGVPYDFTRFTASGIRALFPCFEILHLDRCMGPWSAVAYAIDSTVTNSFSSKTARRFAATASRFLLGWLKWLDALPVPKGRSLATTSGITLVGRKTKVRLSQKQLLDELRALFP